MKSGLFLSLVAALLITGAGQLKPSPAQEKQPGHISDSIKVPDELSGTGSSLDNLQASSGESGFQIESSGSNNPESRKAQPQLNDRSLFSTVKQGGSLMIFIILLQLISMTLIIERLIYFTKNRVWSNKQLTIDITGINSRSAAKFKEEREDELKGAFRIYSNSLERGLGLLSGIGNISPLVGFLGTVIGMISAFASIAAATTVNAKVVAVGIQIALVTTAGGLIVAAPALGFYFLFIHIIQNRYSHAEEIIGDLCGKLPRLSDKPGREGVTSE